VAGEELRHAERHRGRNRAAGGGEQRPSTGEVHRAIVAQVR
jgi:hypothetical protein